MRTNMRNETDEPGAQQDRLALFLAMLGAGIAALAAALFHGLGAGWSVAYLENKFFPIGLNPFRDLALRYFLIAICFLLFGVLARQKQLFFSLIAMAPLVFILHQTRIVLLSEPARMPDWVTNYSPYLGATYYIGPVVLIVGLSLAGLYVWSVWKSNT